MPIDVNEAPGGTNAPSGVKASDAHARQEALDRTRSFIVRAPAGSGKTELLTQRFLSLLAIVDEPEQIVALTFTRKAAAEMRARILKQLHAAQEALPVDAPAHQQLTWHLARQALQQDARQQWGILQAPQRLRLLTIDALCSDLVHQLPLISGLGHYAVTDQASELYEQAVAELFADLDMVTPWQGALKTLLSHCDNRLDHLSVLCQRLLAQREQWLALMAASQENPLQLKRLLEDNFRMIVQQNMDSLDRVLAADVKVELLAYLQMAAVLAAKNAEQWQVFTQYATWPEPTVKHLVFWQTLARFLLTKDGQLRKRLDANGGFPPPSKAPDSATKLKWQQHKDGMQTLLTQLAENPAIHVGLQNNERLPEPSFAAEEWPLCQAIFSLLPALLVYWRLTCDKWQQTDFSEVSWSARQALGSVDQPSELALHCDYRIRHWLIDEFQDTSIAQFDLLTQLTAGWQSGDGRTIFLVGDPLQSIYRFRQAEVSLFWRVWQQGFAAISVTPLSLTQNFRSRPALIKWFNEELALNFPQAVNWQAGAVPYTQVTAAQMELGAESPVQTHLSPDEPGLLVEILQKELAQGSRVAILVKARSHLAAILPALQREGIAYRAVELTALAQQPVVMDLLIGLRILLYRDDRLSWAALLRAPWGGALCLSDWHRLVESQDRRFIWPWAESLSGISDEGLRQLERITPVLTQVFAQRHRQSLSQCLLQLWQGLGADRYWVEPTAQLACEKFWQLLRQEEKAGDLQDSQRFERILAKTYLEESKEASVEIMTIHKAKGLEFDVVILPGQNRRVVADEAPLFLFDSLYGLDGARWLLAPMKAVEVKFEPRYDFLRHLQQQKRLHEAQRLFYVACTRARQRLYLLGESAAIEDCAESLSSDQR